MRPEAFLKALDDAQQQHSKGALMHPQNTDAYEYGRVVGMYQGLEHAKALFVKLLGEAERRSYDL